MNERDKELAAQNLVTEIANAIEKCVKAAVETEREACAALAQQTICDTHIPTGINIYGTRAAKAIRARSNA